MTSFQHHSVLPSFPQSVQAFSFDPSHPSILIMAFPNNSLQIYDVEGRQFPTWGQELCYHLPKRFKHAHDPVLGVTFDPAVVGESPSSPPRYVLFWGSTWVCKMPINEAWGGFNKKRRRESMTHTLAPPDDHPIKMITYFRPNLFVDFMAAGELIVVERPLVDVLSTLPPAYFKHKYGAS